MALLRIGAGGEPETLMGQRGGGAAFMPSKVVFPGGALDPEDRHLAAAISQELASDALDQRLWRTVEGDCETGAPSADIPEGPLLGLSLALSAIRETFEETGLRMGRAASNDADAAWAATARDLGGDWGAFADLGGDGGSSGAAPSPEAMGFMFRAITPPSKSRRFDARFFVAHAGDLLGDVEDFSGASGELGALAWIPLANAADFDLPFITQIVIAELQAIAAACAEEAEKGDRNRGLSTLARRMRNRPVPFFRHRLDPGKQGIRPVFEAV